MDGVKAEQNNSQGLQKNMVEERAMEELKDRKKRWHNCVGVARLSAARVKSRGVSELQAVFA